MEFEREYWQGNPLENEIDAWDKKFFLSTRATNFLISLLKQRDRPSNLQDELLKKRLLDVLERRATSEMLSSVEALLNDDKYILAIKLVREVTGKDLREAKNFVDSHPAYKVMKVRRALDGGNR